MTTRACTYVRDKHCDWVSLAECNAVENSTVFATNKKKTNDEALLTVKIDKTLRRY